MKQNPTVIIRHEEMRARVVQHIASLNIEKPWAITIEPYKKRRSLGQLGLMWAWVETVAKHVHEATGQDKEDIHEFFKQNFLQPRLIEINNETATTWSTKGLTTAEMAIYMDQIYAWVTTELGLLLPVPQDWAA